MKGDLTRNTFLRHKHYTGVRMQQGRVQLDADWNEELDILAHLDRTTRVDVIGHCGGPIHAAGFEVTSSGDALTIHQGRYYVQGQLCENESDHNLTAQPDLPGLQLPTTPGTYLAYLDVWEWHVTALEDPDIREVALGGPDTTTRTRLLAQVKLIAVDGQAECADFGPDWTPADALSTGQLSAQAEPAAPGSVCEVPAQGGYRRLENQLYRVEIHQNSASGTPSYKWSRENGSVLFAWVGQDGSDKLLISAPPRDSNLGLATDDWLELTDDTRELQGRPGVMARVLLVDETVITIDLGSIQDPDDPGATGVDFSQFGPNPKLRRWESAGAEAVVRGVWLELEDGVQIQFSPEAGADQFQTGDYWLIPARTATGDVLWPDGQFDLRHGIHHAYCPLALLDLSEETWTVLSDCRQLFPPLTELPTHGDCCTVTVGDGISSQGDFTDLQAAVDSLGGYGRVCLLPGVYRLPQTVLVEGGPITISGCGVQSYLIAEPGRPALTLQGGPITLQGLYIEAQSAEGAITALECAGLRLEKCLIVNQGQEVRWPERLTNLLERRSRFHGSDGPDVPFLVREEASVFLAGPRSADFQPAGILTHRGLRRRRSDGPAVLALACQDIHLHDNQLIGLPAAALQGEGITAQGNTLEAGGLWVWDGSSHIHLVDNHIHDGEGAGITLGGSQDGDNLRAEAAGVQGATIEGNHISGMTGSGIASLVELERQRGNDKARAARRLSIDRDLTNPLTLGNLADVIIRHNVIEGCALEGPDPTYDGQAVGGIVLSNVSRLQVQGNRIRANGVGGVPAVGVYVFLGEDVVISGNDISENGSAAIVARACIDFGLMEPQQGETPLILEEVTFTFDTFDGPSPVWQIDFIRGGSALNCLWGTHIALPAPTTSVTLVLTALAGPVTVVATSEDGSQDAIEVEGELQSVTLTGASIVRVDIFPPQNETWLHEICWGAADETLPAFQAGIVALYVLGGDYEDSEDPEERFTYQRGGPALLVENNVVVCPAGQALIGLGLGPMLVSDNILTARGEFEQPPLTDDPENPFNELYQSGRCVSLNNLGLMEGIEGFFGLALTQRKVVTHRAASDFQATRGFFVAPAVTPASTLTTGQLLLHGNQINQQRDAPSDDLAYPSVWLLSYDDAAAQDNQIHTRLAGLQLANLGVVGMTVRVSDNRVSELLNTALLSIYTQGAANTTSDNQCTHCLGVVGTLLVNRDNLVLNPTACERLKELLAAAGGPKVDPPTKVAGQISHAQVMSQMQNLSQAVTLSQASSLRQVSRVQASQATRLSQVATRLTPNLGTGHARVNQLNRSIARAHQVETLTANYATRLERLPQPDDHEWVVAGQVRTTTGRPLAGLQVRLFDQDRKLDDFLGQAITDEFGDFRIIYHERDFLESGEGAPELYVMVSDAAGRLLFTSRDQLRFNAGRLEWFDISLEV